MKQLANDMKRVFDTWMRMFYLAAKALIFLYLLRTSVDWLVVRYGDHYELFIYAAAALAATVVFTDKRQGGQE